MRAPRKPRSRRGASANPARGEHSLTLAGVAYRLRPSFAAAVAIEEELGASLLELLRKADRCALSFTELGTICAEYIRAGADDGDKMTKAVSADRIAELIYEEGAPPVYAVLVLVLADAISGGRTASGEVRAVTETTATVTA